MITIIDYGAGNLFSVKNAFDYLGIPTLVSANKDELSCASSLVLPGVGAFPDAMHKLEETGLIETIKAEAKVKPFLGICVGMQMLFDTGFEFEETAGLGLLPGIVNRIVNPGEKIPHMGWNSLTITSKNFLSDKLKDGDMVYFVHSFKAVCEDKYISAYTTYGDKIPALVTDGANIFGTQFHPEKSGEVGLGVLKAFAGLE